MKFLSFSQRHGYEGLPEPMRLEELSDELRREVWNTMRIELLDLGTYNPLGRRIFNPDGERYVERALGRYLKVPESRVNTDFDGVLEAFELKIMEEGFNRVLDLLEIWLNDPLGRQQVAIQIANIFKDCVAPYRLNLNDKPMHFFPITSEEQGNAVQHSLETLVDHRRDGASTHLRQAVEHINARQFSDSVADSILAVESVARTIDPDANRTLTPALNALERDGILRHSALKQAFVKLYGYTNDQEGIRHALINSDSPDVDMHEAIFMFGVCASFAAYLSAKHNEMAASTGNSVDE